MRILQLGVRDKQQSRKEGIGGRHDRGRIGRTIDRGKEDMNVDRGMDMGTVQEQGKQKRREKTRGGNRRGRGGGGEEHYLSTSNDKSGWKVWAYGGASRLLLWLGETIARGKLLQDSLGVIVSLTTSNFWSALLEEMQKAKTRFKDPRIHKKKSCCCAKHRGKQEVPTRRLVALTSEHWNSGTWGETVMSFLTHAVRCDRILQDGPKMM
ncbi:hypothetical protein Tco_0618449 [Tanacetum coccineum]